MLYCFKGGDIMEGIIIIGAILLFIVSLTILKGFFCWVFRINEQIKLLTEIRDNLKK